MPALEPRRRRERRKRGKTPRPLRSQTRQGGRRSSIERPGRRLKSFLGTPVPLLEPWLNLQTSLQLASLHHIESGLELRSALPPRYNETWASAQPPPLDAP